MYTPLGGSTSYTHVYPLRYMLEDRCARELVLGTWAKREPLHHVCRSLLSWIARPLALGSSRTAWLSSLIPSRSKAHPILLFRVVAALMVEGGARTQRWTKTTRPPTPNSPPIPRQPHLLQHPPGTCACYGQGDPNWSGAPGLRRCTVYSSPPKTASMKR